MQEINESKTMNENEEIKNQPQPNSHYEKKQGMKWFKFLIYFSLWFSAVINIITGIMYFSGSIYQTQGVSASQVYSVFPSLKGVDGIYGLITCALGVYAVVTRFCLAKFKKCAPLMVYLLYALPAIIGVIYSLAVTAIAQTPIDVSMVGSVVGASIAVWLNVIYFQKRRFLFIF